MSASESPNPSAAGAAEPPDLRLLPLAAAVWLGVGVVLLVQPGQPLVLAVAGGGGALLAPVVARVLAGASQGSGPVQRRRSSGAVGPATLVVTGVLLGIAVGAVHVARLHPPVVQQVARETAVVSVDAVITGDPRVHWPAEDDPRQAEPRWTARARVGHLTARGVSHAVAVPVVLRGDAVRSLAYGSHVHLTGRASPSWRPESSGLVLSVLGSVHVRSPPGRVARVTTAIREGFREAVGGLPTDAAALLLGLAVGDESLVSPQLEEAMIRSGLAHLTAVSGTNTAIVVGLALGFAAVAGWRWQVRVAWGILALAGYVALVRPQPSVLRAALMGLVGLLALSTGGRRRGPPALMGAVLLLLLGWPEFALSLGFALSVAATAGLLLVGPAIATRLAVWPVARRTPEPVRAALAVAAAAHTATLPLAVLMGNGASLVALPANVVVTPLVPVATVLGLAAALLAPIAAPPAGLLAHLAAPATGAIAWVAHRSSEVPSGVLPVPGGTGPAVATAVVLGIGVLCARRGWRPWRDRRVQAGVGLVVAVGIAMRIGADQRWPPSTWVVLACDVGQGDGLLLRRPGAREVLVVDVGPSGAAMADCIRDAGVRPAAVLLTHAHADHVDGLPAVLDGWDVPLVLTSAEAPGALTGDAAARSAGVPVRAVQRGDVLEVAGLRVQVLWPARRISRSPENNASVVVLVEVPTERSLLRVLLTGDIEAEAQRAVMARTGGSVDVVKIPHHGSRYQGEGFASWAGAGIAVVSAGAGNDHGHPSEDTLERYREAGAIIGRTDTQGALAVVGTPRGPGLIVQR